MTGSLKERLSGVGGTHPAPVWIKADAYARKVLLGSVEADPWSSAAGYLTWFSQMRSLLRPAVAVIEPAALFDAQALRDGGLAAKLGNRRRPTQALRRLLEPEQPKALLDEVIGAVLSQLRGGEPLVLAIPSPRAWLLHANRLAGGDDAEVDADAVEDGAVYVADLLRSISRHALSGLLLEELADDASPPTDVKTAYSPVLNVAAHYRWSPVLRMPPGKMASLAVSGFDAVIGAEVGLAAGLPLGLDTSAEFAAGAAPPTHVTTSFHFVEITPTHSPAAVLLQLERWRTAA